jgi:hypothetical protein
MNYPELTEFQLAYVVAMLWSTNDESDEQGGDPLDANYDYGDLSPEALETVIKDCETFQTLAKPWLTFAGDDSQNGHDLWLTRNGHGCGFWDRGYSKPVSDKLSEIAESMGEQWPHAHNGKIYID